MKIENLKIKMIKDSPKTTQNLNNYLIKWIKIYFSLKTNWKT